MPSKIDLVGKIFGLIKVGSPAPSRSGKTYWNCSCIKCGATKIIQGSHLTTGVTKTCGCGWDFLYWRRTYLWYLW